MWSETLVEGSRQTMHNVCTKTLVGMATSMACVCALMACGRRPGLTNPVGSRGAARALSVALSQRVDESRTGGAAEQEWVPLLLRAAADASYAHFVLASMCEVNDG